MIRRSAAALAGALSMGVALSILGVPVGTGAYPAAGGAGPAHVLPPDGRWSVTLLTGEVVDVRADAHGRASVTVGEDSGPVTTLRYPTGELFVFPATALGSIGSVLDPELFDVTGLVQQHYDDASIDVVPVIVQRTPGTDPLAALGINGVAEEPLASVGAVAIKVPKSATSGTGDRIAARAEAAPGPADPLEGVTKVWLDRRMTTASGSSDAPAPAALDPNLTQVGADHAWAAGITGAGTSVGILDAGVDAEHPDLAGQVVAEETFSESPDAADHSGHGTHVASLIAGTGAAAGGARRGVAPDADLVVGKVLDDNGFGFESDVIEGMEWAAPQTDVVNMSLGGPDESPDRPIDIALDNLTSAYGTLFVVAAGNFGPISASVGTPGTAAEALTVGSVDVHDLLAEFSSRGPVTDDFQLKPEIVAPGVDIVAARAAGTSLGDPVDDLYTTLSGTSMATPHVAGAAALLAQEHPDWSADDIKIELIDTAAPITGDGYDVGAGRLAIDAAITATVHAERDVVEAELPRPRNQPHRETLTWTNTGTEARTLILDADLEDRQGNRVDAVSVDPAEVAVPAGATGTGTATLTIDGEDLDDGLYSGFVTAHVQETGETVRTPLAVHAAPDEVDLTIKASPLDSAVGPPPDVLVSIVNLDDFAEFDLLALFEGDTFTVQVPVGRYAVIGAVLTTDPDNTLLGLVGDPDVTISTDTIVVFDGAAAQPLDPHIAGVRTAPPLYSQVDVAVTPRAGTAGESVSLGAFTRYPIPPVYVTPMDSEVEGFTTRQTFRVQAPFVTARVGSEPIEVTLIDGFAPHPGPAEGRSTFTAFDAGDGSDLSQARDRLAVVTLPADRLERAAVTQRAASAGARAVAFVDDQRPRLTLATFNAGFEPWGEIPVIAAGGHAASLLRAAATAGDDVTVTMSASPYVYDIVGPVSRRLAPDPVVSRAQQAELATITEQFHRDPGTGAALRDRRGALPAEAGPVLAIFEGWGPLARQRVAHVSPDVVWSTAVLGSKFVPSPFGGGPVRAASGLSTGTPESYAPGSRQTRMWLARPQWPGPIGPLPVGDLCPPDPVARTANTLHVQLAPFQDGRDRYGCEEPTAATLALERDGAAIDTVDGYQADFPVPAEAGTYRLTYQQTGAAPYQHTSSTTWTFRSAPPAGDELVPLLVVDYKLPLDTLNRPTSRTARLSVDQVTGTEEDVRYLKVWTSTDGGETWRPASSSRIDGHRWDVRLPSARPGTAVSLRVDSADADGHRIEQTLIGAYTA